MLIVFSIFFFNTYIIQNLCVPHYCTKTFITILEEKKTKNKKIRINISH